MDLPIRCVGALGLAGLSLLGARAGAAQGRTTADPGELARGVVIERVACLAGHDQSYALYLPFGYSTDRSWPILYAFDPGAQGARPVRLAVEAAERFGWIVAGSNDSRNGPMRDNQNAMLALLRDTQARLAVDARRVYAAGFSGGARAAAALALGCHGCVAGVFASGAGLPNGMQRAPAFDFAWFGAAGERDMNYAELFVLEQELLKRGARQRLHRFDGGHEWAPPEVLGEALGWFELLEMRDGRRPRDAALLTSLFEQSSARAARSRERGERVDEQRELTALVRDFDGLADTAAARRRLEELTRSSAYRKALKRERQMVDEQYRIVGELQAALNQLAQAGGEDQAELMMRATRDAHALARGLSHARQSDERLVHERALAQVFIGAMEAARSALRQQQTARAAWLFEIAASLRPASPAPQLGLAQAQARAGKKREALESLQRARQLGLSAAELRRLLESDEAVSGLRDDPQLLPLLETPPRSP